MKLIFIVLVSCGSDKIVAVVHGPPAVSLTTPVEGEGFEQGEAIAFDAIVRDDRDPAPDLAVTWSSDRDGPLNTDPADADGHLRFTTGMLSAGAHVITVEVRNSQALTAEDSVAIDVDPNAAPTVSVRSPNSNDLGVEGVPFPFEALVRDEEDAAGELSVWFESDLDDVFCEPTPDPDGFAACEAALPPGDHVITVGVRDTDGNEATAEATFAVLEADASDDDLDGYSEGEGDCDDADPSIRPGGAEYANEVDDDCDGVIDEGTVNVDDDLDGYTELAGDCDDGDDDTFPGALEVCDGIDNDCDLALDDGTSCVDDDGDGYTEIDGDCDDASTGAFPGAIEVGDGADNDCDGTADEGTELYDDDGDCACEAGACTGSAEAACAALVDGDCDDGDDAVSPAADEHCNTRDDDCDGTADEADAVDATDWYRDADGDFYGDASVTTPSCAQPSGYVADATDCDDGDASTSPADPELCDGADDDCDGATDEATATDAPTWYADADADGYGTATVTTRACTVPSGYVATLTDCDDASAAIHPAASESCDGVDNDCDGSADEPSAIDATVWYVDVDGDGYGSAASSTTSCARPGGYSSVATDCDDSSAAVSPAAAEICNAVDDDCDGGADDGVTMTWYRDADGDGYGTSGITSASCAAPTGYVSNSSDCDDADADLSPDTVWCRDGDGDGYGDASVTRTQCAQPAGYVADDTDCNDATSSARPGGAESCDTLDNDCDGSVDERNASGCRAYYTDADGDGYGAEGTSSRCYCSATSTYTATNDDDCYDGEANANPAATAYYTVDRGDGSHDYDCDGSESRRYTDNFDCTGAAYVCWAYTDGWSTSADPTCGSTSSWRTGCSASFTSCSYGSSASRTQSCR